MLSFSSYLQIGELFYARMLLLHRAAQSFHDLRTIDGIEFPTFHEAACQLGLFDDQHKGQQALQEAVECL